MNADDSVQAPDETGRLQALSTYEVLDSGFDEELGDVVALASASVARRFPRSRLSTPAASGSRPA